MRPQSGANLEQALKQGDLGVARAILTELVELPDTGGLWMPECYADLPASTTERATTVWRAQHAKS